MINQQEACIKAKWMKKTKLKLNNKKKLKSKKVSQFQMTKELSQQHRLNKHLHTTKEIKFQLLVVGPKYFWKIEKQKIQCNQNKHYWT